MYVHMVRLCVNRYARIAMATRKSLSDMLFAIGGVAAAVLLIPVFPVLLGHGWSVRNAWAVLTFCALAVGSLCGLIGFIVDRLRR